MVAESPAANEKQKPGGCRLCTDFQDILKPGGAAKLRPAEHASSSSASSSAQSSAADTTELKTMPCPPDSRELGRSTWTFLHTTAAKYPERPAEEDARAFRDLMHSVARLYPCSYCARELREDLKKHPDIPVDNRRAVEQWMCALHNRVNRRLGKPQFDCRLAHRRWLTGCSEDADADDDFNGNDKTPTDNK